MSEGFNPHLGSLAFHVLSERFPFADLDWVPTHALCDFLDKEAGTDPEIIQRLEGFLATWIYRIDAEENDE